MSTVTARLVSQFGRPRGLAGHLAGIVMATRASNRARNLWTVEQLDIRPSDRVLEIGYGPGVGVAHAARRAARVVGVDVSRVMRRHAALRNRRGVASGRVDLRVGTIDDLLSEAPFTKAMAVNVFMFWPDPVAFLRSLSPLLAPGATVALTMQPRGATASDAAAAAVGERMAEALRMAGFVDIDLRTLAYKPVNAVCALGRRPSSS